MRSNKRRAAHLGQHDVEIAVAVNVGKGRAAADDRLEQIAARLLRRITAMKPPPSALTGVPEQLRRLRVGLALLDLADLLLQVAVGRQQIQPAVQIVIEKEHAELEQQPAGRADAFGDGFVSEIRAACSAAT